MTLHPAEILGLALQCPAALPPQAAAEVTRAGLGGWVWSQLPAGHPLKGALQPQRLALLARHLQVRRALLPLLRSWSEAGVDVMLLKGFAHAEFLYAEPSQRFYGDVDVMIHEHDLPRAMQAATQLGWQSDGLEREPRRWTHEIAQLLSPDGQAKLDVHRSVTAHWPLAAGKVRRVTRAFWQAARPLAWSGLRHLWQPDPRDQLLLVALTRAWSGDAAHLKPADLLDDRALRGRYGLSSAVMDDRAAALGCLHTWRAFDRALRGSGDGPSPRRAAARVRRRALLDGHPLALGKWPRRVLEAPQIVADIVRALPYALAARRDLARGGDVRTLAARSTLGPAQPRVHEAAWRLTRGTRWALKLVYPRGATCLPRALSTYRALVAAGVPVSFVSGVRRHGAAIEGHAWVEFPGLLDALYGEPESARRYRTIYRCSAAPGGGEKVTSAHG